MMKTIEIDFPVGYDRVRDGVIQKGDYTLEPEMFSWVEADKHDLNNSITDYYVVIRQEI